MLFTVSVLSFSLYSLLQWLFITLFSLLIFEVKYFNSNSINNTGFSLPSISEAWSETIISYPARIFGIWLAFQLIFLQITVWGIGRQSHGLLPWLNLLLGIVWSMAFSLMPSVCSSADLPCRGNSEINTYATFLFFIASSCQCYLIVFQLIDTHIMLKLGLFVTNILISLGSALSFVYLIQSGNMLQWIHPLWVLGLTSFYLSRNKVDVLVVYTNIPYNTRWNVHIKNIFYFLAFTYAIVIVFIFVTNVLQGHVHPLDTWPSITQSMKYPPSNWITHWWFNGATPILAICHIAIYYVEKKVGKGGIFNAFLLQIAFVAMFGLSMIGSTTDPSVHKPGVLLFFVGYNFYMISMDIRNKLYGYCCKSIHDVVVDAVVVASSVIVVVYYFPGIEQYVGKSALHILEWLDVFIILCIFMPFMLKRLSKPAATFIIGVSLN